MDRRTRRPVLAAVVVPLVMILGLQSAWAAYACRVDGKVRDHCCCGTKRERGPADGAPRLVKQACCEVSIADKSRAPEARDTGRVTLEHHATVTRIAMLPAATPTVGHVAAKALSARGPPRVPIFLDKHAILR